MATSTSSTSTAVLVFAALLVGVAAGSRYLPAGERAAAPSEVAASAEVTASSELAAPGPLTLQHTTLVVSDFDASMAFYSGLLGLEPVEAPFLPERQAFLALGEGLELHMGEVPDVEIRPSTFNHFAITSPDFDAFLEYLREQGVVYTNLGGGEDYFVQTRPDGVRQTYLEDPDGYWVEVNDFR